MAWRKRVNSWTDIALLKKKINEEHSAWARSQCAASPSACFSQACVSSQALRLQSSASVTVDPSANWKFLRGTADLCLLFEAHRKYLLPLVFKVYHSSFAVVVKVSLE